MKLKKFWSVVGRAGSTPLRSTTGSTLEQLFSFHSICSATGTHSVLILGLIIYNGVSLVISSTETMTNFFHERHKTQLKTKLKYLSHKRVTV